MMRPRTTKPTTVIVKQLSIEDRAQHGARFIHRKKTIIFTHIKTLAYLFCSVEACKALFELKPAADYLLFIHHQM